MCIFCQRGGPCQDGGFGGFGGLGLGGVGETPVKPWGSTMQAVAQRMAPEQPPALTVSQKREVEACGALVRLPCTIITGFLGSGKTTVLNHILRGQHHKKFAVIENEFGEVGIDQSLLSEEGQLERSSTEVILMPNGCICCRVRGDLIEALKRFCGPDAPELDGILIECSGLAQCAPVAQTFFLDAFVQRYLQLDAILCVCDSPRVVELLAAIRCATTCIDDSELSLINEQLSMADVVLLNKSQCVDQQAMSLLASHAVDISSSARILQIGMDSVTNRLDLDLELICGIRAFSLEQALNLDEHFPEGDHHHHQEHGHARLGYSSVGIEHREAPLDWELLNKWLQTICEEHSTSLCRFKAVLWCVYLKKETRVVVQVRWLISSSVGVLSFDRV